MKKQLKKFQIGVIGYAGPEEYPSNNAPKKSIYKIAEDVGFFIAQKGAVVVTGGKSGVMEFATRGAKKAGGITIGVVKGKKRFTSNKFTDIEFITGMESDGMDEIFIVNMCDAFIVIGGGAGTLQEISVAYRNKKPIIIIKDTGGWADKINSNYLDERKTVNIQIALNAKDAVKKAFDSIKI